MKTKKERAKAVFNAMSPPPERVIYRTYPSQKEDVVALFPDDIADSRGNITCYAHFGQHGSADYDAVMTRTRPSTEEEKDTLARELRRVGYTSMREVLRRR